MYAVISEYFNFDHPEYNECDIISFHATLDSAKEKVNILKGTDEYVNLKAQVEKVILRIVKMDVVEEA